MRRVDSKRRKILHGSFAKEVVADFGDHHNRRAAEPRGHGLVRALAAKAKIKALAEDGFARPGKCIS